MELRSRLPRDSKNYTGRGFNSCEASFLDAGPIAERSGVLEPPRVPPAGATVQAAERVKKKVEPSPKVDSTHTFPPWRSTILRTTASPIPVPS